MIVGIDISKDFTLHLSDGSIFRGIDPDVIIQLLIQHCQHNDINQVIVEGLLNDPRTSDLRRRTILSEILYILKLITRELPHHGIIVSTVNANFTSQKCSVCGYISDKSRKSKMTFRCIQCNQVMDADLNAAKNILDKFEKILVEVW